MELYTNKSIGVKDKPGRGFTRTIQMAGRSKAWFCGRSLAGIVGSNPAWGMNVGWWQVEVSAKVLSIVRISPAECGVPECNCEASTMRGPGPVGAFAPRGRGARRGSNNFKDSRIPVALPLYCYDRGFESRWGYGFSSPGFVVCCVGSYLCDELNSSLRRVPRVLMSNCVWSTNMNSEKAQIRFRVLRHSKKKSNIRVFWGVTCWRSLNSYGFF
jgi:hypothetical protein